jgi:hypothetical protein
MDRLSLKQAAVLESRSKRVVGVVDDMHRYPPTGRREENVKRM